MQQQPLPPRFRIVAVEAEALDGDHDSFNPHAVFEPEPELAEVLEEAPATKSAAVPVTARQVNRVRLAWILGGVIGIAVLWSLLGNRAQWKGIALQNAPDPNATPAATPTPTASPTPIQLDAAVVALNDAVDQALKEAAQQQEAIDQARRDVLLDQAYNQTKKDGTPIEVSLIRELNRQQIELRRLVGRGGEWSGTASQIEQARALVGDARAVVLALQSARNEPDAAPGRSRVAPALLTKKLMDLSELAEVVRSAEFEQQLRNAERARQEAGAGDGATTP